MPQDHSSNTPRKRNLSVFVGAALGSVLGWLLSPVEFRGTGLGIGAVVGMLVVEVGHRWLRIRRYGDSILTPLGFGGHAFYLVVMTLCLYLMWLAVEKGLEHPEEWFDALVVLVLFGSGAVAVVLFWIRDASPIPRQTTETKQNMVLSICSFIFAVGSGFVAYRGSILLGAAGFLFCSWCGLILLRRTQNEE